MSEISNFQLKTYNKQSYTLTIRSSVRIFDRRFYLVGICIWSGPDRYFMDYCMVRSGFSVFRTKFSGPKTGRENPPWYGLIGPKSVAYAGSGSNPDQNLDHGPDRRISDKKSVPDSCILTSYLVLISIKIHCFQSKNFVSKLRILLPF